MLLIQSIMMIAMAGGAVQPASTPPPLDVAPNIQREPTMDELVEQRVGGFERWLEQTPGEQVNEQIQGKAGEVLAGLDIARMSPRNLARLGMILLVDGSKVTDATLQAEKFTHPSKADTVEYATGLTVSLWLTMHSTQTLPTTEAIDDLLNSPQLGESVEMGNALPLYDMLATWTTYFRDAEAVKARAPRMSELLGRSFTSELSTDAMGRGVELSGGLVKLLGAKQTKPMQDRILAGIESKMSGTSGTERAALEELRAQAGLIGGVAPALNFAWSSDGFKAKTLADLKGRVVVLDFWATWCGPCIRSFPKITELTEHYKGYPVTVLGVTSAQGFVMVNGERVQARDEAHEQKMMGTFYESMEMSWPVVMTTQPVFNKAYGVGGIPHIAIVAPDGTLRHNGLHPMMPAAEEHAMIDGLLKEFGLPHPEH